MNTRIRENDQALSHPRKARGCRALQTLSRRIPGRYESRASVWSAVYSTAFFLRARTDVPAVRLHPIIVLLIVFLTIASTPASERLQHLSIYPPEINLSSANGRQQLVVQAVYDNGLTRDVTDQATLKISAPKLASIKSGVISPKTNGTTELRVSFKGSSASVPVTITNSAARPDLSFKLDVMPVFTKAGCNAGSCHGSSRGKDGFRLSLFGFDPDGDYFRLTREQIGRRVNLALPEESLIVQKGLGAVQHTGGVRFSTNSDLCQTLIRWLVAGAPKDSDSVAHVTGLEIFPRNAVLEGANAKQHLTVRASYSDGTQRDVTRLTVFISNNDVSAKVSEDGLLTSAQPGEAFIQARFAEYNVGCQALVVAKNPTYNWPSLQPVNYVDENVFAKLKRMRMVPSELCDDASFIRRASLDLNGRLPTKEELEQFLNDTRPDRRKLLVDQLLARKEFAELWVMKFAELLEIRSRDNRVYPKAAVLYFEWLRDQMEANVPLDQIVRNLLTASESNFRNPPANYWQIEPDTLKLAENTAQVFMGTRIQCAQCHNHPFDRWTMNDYYGFAAFFTQVGRKPGDDPRETVIYDRNEGEMKHPVTGAILKPKFLGAGLAETNGKSRREALASWLTSADNPYFARNIANIVWAHCFGRGIVEPVDDTRISNPASNPELLEALAAKLTEYHFDLKRLMRDVCLSRTYQLSTRPNKTNETDDRNFSKASIRRIRAELLLDCVSQVTETQDKFNGLPRGARAVEIADGNTSTYFLTTFGRATRSTVCSCEVKIDPNLSQALHLLNGNTVQDKIENGGVVRRMLKQSKSPEQIIQELYLRCLSRKPTVHELQKLGSYLEGAKKAEQVLNDVFWSLLNSKEFVFNH
jgi:hypothetical protein